MKKSSCLFFLILLFLPLAAAGAVDFGLMTYQEAGYGNRESSENKFDYQADIIPRFSLLIGEDSDFFMSARITLGEDNGFYFIPELLRTTLTLRSGGWGIRAGRMHYADPLAFIADGLFDGVQFFYHTEFGSFNAGVWYTGLLCKYNANITMTDEEQFSYDAPFALSDFSNTYFAPRRLLAALDWEHPSVGEFMQLKASLINQTDLTGAGAGEKINSQYLVLKAGILLKSLLFELGGSIETAETTWEDEHNLSVAFAWDFGIFWKPPTSFASSLSLCGHFAGGKLNDTVEAFVPVTTIYYGNIFRQKLSSLSVIDLNYSARITDTIGASLSALYFVRGDLGTYTGYPVSGDGYFLGAEFFGSIIWSPASDLQFDLGAGAFLPSLGDAGLGDAGEKTQWRVELRAIFALY